MVCTFGTQQKQAGSPGAAGGRREAEAPRKRLCHYGLWGHFEAKFLDLSFQGKKRNEKS